MPPCNNRIGHSHCADHYDEGNGGSEKCLNKLHELPIDVYFGFWFCSKNVGGGKPTLGISEMT